MIPQNLHQLYPNHTQHINGNYIMCRAYDNKLKKDIRWRALHKDYTKTVASYPELVDIKLTNFCKEGCSFCYQSSNAKEDNCLASFMDVVRQLPKNVEFALGGGDVLLIADELAPQLATLRAEGYTELNATVKASSIWRSPDKFKMLYESISNWGISITSLDEWEQFKMYVIIAEDEDTCRRLKTLLQEGRVQFHLIPDLLKEDLSPILSDIRLFFPYASVLFLGFKLVGRGKKYDKKLQNDMINIIESYDFINVDTQFVHDYLIGTQYEHNCTYLEGEYSLNIDLVKNVITKSSYDYTEATTFDVEYGVINAFKAIQAQVIG